MPILTTPEALVNMNGSLWYEVNQYEPTVAERGEFQSSPLTLESEMTGKGPEYSGQEIIKTTEVEFDELGRVVLEKSTTFNSRYGTQTVHIIRDWEGEDYTEVVHVEAYDGSDDIEEGFRRTIDDTSKEVRFNGRTFRVYQRTTEDGNTLLEAEEDSSLKLTTLIDPSGKTLSNTLTTPNDDASGSATHYFYDENGLLSHTTGPSGMVMGGEPQPRVVRIKRKAGGADSASLVTVTTRVSPGEQGDPERLEKRSYNGDGEFVGANVEEGFIDIGKITTSYVIERALASL